jgi:hypothetical protein
MQSDSYEVCGGHQGCISKVAFACTCGEPVVFLCKSCVIDHLSYPVAHVFISLEQARGLMNDFSLNDKFHENLAKFTVLKASIQEYINKLKRWKDDLIEAKNKIIKILFEVFEQRLDALHQNHLKAVSYLFKLKRNVQKSAIHEDEIFRIYDSDGLNGVVEDYIRSFDIKTDEIMKTIMNSFAVSSDDSIFATIHKRKELLKYDPCIKQSRTICFEDKIPDYFYCSSTCILPDGNLMIVGGFDPSLGNTYKFNTKTHECTKLNSLNTARVIISLICHDKYLYAFGGATAYRSKIAERMEWLGNGWTNLPEMKEARYGLGIISMSDKIYLIGGGATSIEYYDTKNNCFNIVPNILFESDNCFAALIHDKIYILLNSKLKILSKDFEYIEEEPLSIDEPIYCLHKPVIKGRKIYFINYYSQDICIFNAAYKSLDILRI